MKRRAGTTATFSISVDKETQKILKAEAAKHYGGNVSALVSAIAKEAKRQSAFEWILRQSGQTPMTGEEQRTFLEEIDGKSPTVKRRRRAA